MRLQGGWPAARSAIDLLGRPVPWQALQLRRAAQDLRSALLRCDLCRRFAPLQLGPHRLRDIDYRTERLSCSVCGTEVTNLPMPVAQPLLIATESTRLSGGSRLGPEATARNLSTKAA